MTLPRSYRHAGLVFVVAGFIMLAALVGWARPAAPVRPSPAPTVAVPR